ncbi:hypothetical protein BCR43DRAFT_530787 [Syncephalastrum racemosum]|uniref:Citrate transporter-like domain-containing protein n=1 Tax=Syncephalastrum racemosum TaxID=13706 RepID=A0A1X2HHC3_SYNRA|nr:hypothetical protein BCR43DRAFT_530787 [Syncephalastrum racemosum]
MAEGGETLDAHSWVALAFFLFALVFVIKPFQLHVKFIPWPIYLNLATMPALSVLILLCSQTIHIQTVRDGVLGTNVGMQPYAIMLLFYSLAYICISLDLTGLFQFLAFWVSRRAGSRGILAFTLFFCLTSLISGLASNDVVILTGTAFLSYFTRVSGIEPTAFLMSEFTTANIASMALYIGNPTNVVVAEAYDITFIEYSAWMLLPTFVSLGIAYIVLRIVFHNQRYVPHVIYSPDADPHSVLIDREGAIFGLVLLGTCMATLVGTSFVSGVSVWMVTLPFALVMLIRDMMRDLGLDLHWNSRLFLRRMKPQPRPVLEQIASRNEALSAASIMVIPPALESAPSSTIPLARIRQHSSSDEEAPEVDMADSKDGDTDVVPPPVRRRTGSTLPGPSSRSSIQSSTQREPGRVKKVKTWMERRLPTTAAVTMRMPWKILPFALSMFVLVEGLSEVGWIGIFAKAMHVFTGHYVATVFGVLLVSLIACQLLNNLPMTILLTRILQHPSFATKSPLITQSAVLGLVVGSNLGACLTTVGSLAGIMFDHILKTKGIHTLGYFQFLKWNLILLPLIAGGCAAVVIGELWFMYIR